MLSKKVLKDIQSLGLKKHRDELGLFVAEGPKIVEELLQLVPASIQNIYATKNWASQKTGIIEIEQYELEKISAMQTPHEVLAVMKQFESKKPDASTFTIYLDAIQDPGNLGTIIRIADWFGIQHIVCSMGCADMYNPKVVQSSMASIARVNVWYDKQEEWLKQQQAPIYAATLNGKNLQEFGQTNRGILIIGNEAKGIRKSFLTMAKHPVTIQKKGNAESLNAAVATGIILSHLLR